MTQPNILKWTLELYSEEMKLFMARYEAKMNDGLNTYSESRKLSNSVHHYCHGLQVVGTPKNVEESDMLRRKTFHVLNTNLQNRRRLNMEHALQYGYGLSEWPEHVKTVAEAGGHLTKIGSPKDRELASQQMLVLLQEVSDNVTPMQRNAVDSIIAHTQSELSMALLDMQDLDGALKYQKMSLKRMRNVAQSSGLHNVIRPLETVANTLSILNRHDEAFQHFEETLGIIRKLYQVEDISLARVLVNYGLSCYFGAMKLTDAQEKRDLMQSSYDKLTEGVQILKRLGVPISDESHSRGVEYIAKALQQGARPKGSSSSSSSGGKSGSSGKKTANNKDMKSATESNVKAQNKRRIEREL
jgi:tetratricopeptide (TPR) repeat protein